MDEYISKEAVVWYLKEYSEKELNRGSFGMITSSVLNKAERAISEMPASDVQPVNDWISVKDRLPKSTRYDCYCFLVTDGDLIHMAYFVENEWMFADSGQAKNKMFYEVTHWMPLPEPPESEDDTE